MNAKDQILTIQLLEKKFQIKCPPDKTEDFQKAVSYLDRKMREIRDSGKATGTEQVAIMAALSTSFDLLTVQQEKDQHLNAMGQRIRDLHHKIEIALSE